MNRLRHIPVGTVFGVLVAIYIAFYLITTVRHNYQLKQQISSEQQQINSLQSANQTLKYQIQYYSTNDYQEEQGRAKLGLQAPGENVIILPHADPNPSTAPAAKAKTAPKRSHWQQWIDFLAGKGA